MVARSGAAAAACVRCGHQPESVGGSDGGQEAAWRCSRAWGVHYGHTESEAAWRCSRAWSHPNAPLGCSLRILLLVRVRTRNA